MPPDLNPVPDGTNGVVRRREPAPVELVKFWGWEFHKAPPWLVAFGLVLGTVAWTLASLLPVLVWWLKT